MSDFAFQSTFTGGNQPKAVTASVTVSDALNVEIDTTVTASSNIVRTVSIDVSQLAVLRIQATGVVTLTVNDDGTPDKTIVLAANRPIDWMSDTGTANPLGSVDVTSMKFTNATGADVGIYFFAAQDPA